MHPVHMPFQYALQPFFCILCFDVFYLNFKRLNVKLSGIKQKSFAAFENGNFLFFFDATL